MFSCDGLISLWISTVKAAKKAPQHWCEEKRLNFVLIGQSILSLDRRLLNMLPCWLVQCVPLQNADTELKDKKDINDQSNISSSSYNLF